MFKQKVRIWMALAFIFQLMLAAGSGQTPAPQSPNYTNQIVTVLEKSGFRYTKVDDGVWEIQATGQNLKEFAIRVALADDVVLVIAKLADRKNLTAKESLLTKLLELNHHFDSAKLALGENMLYARIDVHARLVDDRELKYLVEQIVNVADETYPHIKPFISGAK